MCLVNVNAFLHSIMFDKRIVRGNTYAARILPAETGPSEKRTTS